MNSFLSQYVTVVLNRRLAEQARLDRGRHHAAYGVRRRGRANGGRR